MTYSLDISGNSYLGGDLDVSGNIKASEYFFDTIQFRFIPWTIISSGSNTTNASGCITSLSSSNANTLGTNPTFSSGGSTFNYAYSVVGNTMYLDFNYIATNNTGSTSGSGIYSYIIPGNFTPDTSTLTPSTFNYYTSNTSYSNSYNPTYGSVIGCGNVNAYTGYLILTQIYILQNTSLTTGGGYGIGILGIPLSISRVYSSANWLFQSDSFMNYGFSTNFYSLSFNCSFPIV